MFSYILCKPSGLTAAIAAGWLFGAATVSPVLAGQGRTRTAAAPCAGERCLVLPPPAETGKAVIEDLIRHGRDGCADALPCRLQVIGALPGRGGAIELRATALTW